MPSTARQLALIGASLLAALVAPPSAAAFRAPQLSAQDQKALRGNFALCVAKLKGPYPRTCASVRMAARSPSAAQATGSGSAVRMRSSARRIARHGPTR